MRKLIACISAVAVLAKVALLVWPRTDEYDYLRKFQPKESPEYWIAVPFPSSSSWVRTFTFPKANADMLALLQVPKTSPKEAGLLPPVVMRNERNAIWDYSTNQLIVFNDPAHPG